MRLQRNRTNKRFLTLLGLLPTSVFILALFYMFAMDRLEGTPRTFLQSIQ